MKRSLRDWRDVGDGECAVQPGFHPFGLCPVYGTGCDREKCEHWKHDIPTGGRHYMTREERRTARFQEGAKAMTAGYLQKWPSVAGTAPLERAFHCTAGYTMPWSRPWRKHNSLWSSW